MSARRGHSLANGHVAKVAREVGAKLILDSDAHAPSDLLTPELCRKIAKGAGLADDEVEALLEQNPQELLEELGIQRSIPA